MRMQKGRRNVTCSGPWCGYLDEDILAAEDAFSLSVNLLADAIEREFEAVLSPAILVIDEV